MPMRERHDAECVCLFESQAREQAVGSVMFAPVES